MFTPEIIFDSGLRNSNVGKEGDIWSYGIVIIIIILKKDIKFILTTTHFII